MREKPTHGLDARKVRQSSGFREELLQLRTVALGKHQRRTVRVFTGDGTPGTNLNTAI